MDAKRAVPPPTLFALLAACLAAVGQGYQLPSDEPSLTSSPLLSHYQRQFDALATVMREERLWRNVGNQPVYFVFDRRYYGHIIDNELLQDARGDVKSGQSGESTASSSQTKPDKVDQNSDMVKPLAFIRNLFVSRYRIGSLLDVGVEVLKSAFRCLAYKHTSYMLLTIKSEILSIDGRTDKAPKRSGRAALSVYSIAAKMATALQFIDSRLFRAYSIFRSMSNETPGRPMAKKAANKKASNIQAHANAMGLLSVDMMRYVAAKCVKQSMTENQIARELKLMNVTSLLYTKEDDPEETNKLVKDALNKNWATVDEHFAMPPLRTVDGDPQKATNNLWNELLRYDPRSTWIVPTRSLY